MSISLILALDTSGPRCAAGLMRDGAVCSTKTLEMNRGQAEALMPLLEETLASSGRSWSDIDALAVGIGPGNFTGIRISVSAARGLALARGIPALGISNFEIMAYGQNAENLLVSLPAPRDQVYLQAFTNGKPFAPPRLASLEEIPRDLGVSPDTLLVGHHAEHLGKELECSAVSAELQDIPERMLRIAYRRLVDEDEQPTRPAPLYVRPADAAPPSDPPPVILP